MKEYFEYEKAFTLLVNGKNNEFNNYMQKLSVFCSSRFIMEVDSFNQSSTSKLEQKHISLFFKAISSVNLESVFIKNDPLDIKDSNILKMLDEALSSGEVVFNTKALGFTPISIYSQDNKSTEVICPINNQILNLIHKINVERLIVDIYESCHNDFEESLACIHEFNNLNSLSLDLGVDYNQTHNIAKRTAFLLKELSLNKLNKLYITKQPFGFSANSLEELNIIIDALTKVNNLETLSIDAISSERLEYLLTVMVEKGIDINTLNIRVLNNIESYSQANRVLSLIKNSSLQNFSVDFFDRLLDHVDINFPIFSYPFGLAFAYMLSGSLLSSGLTVGLVEYFSTQNIPTYFSFMLERTIKQKTRLRDEIKNSAQAQTNSKYDLPSINHPAYAALGTTAVTVAGLASMPVVSVPIVASAAASSVALGACVLWNNYRQNTSSQTEEIVDQTRDASSKAKPLL